MAALQDTPDRGTDPCLSRGTRRSPLHFPGLGGPSACLPGRSTPVPSRQRLRRAPRPPQFVAGDRSPQRLGMTLRLLGAHLETGHSRAGCWHRLPRRDAHHAAPRQRGVLVLAPDRAQRTRGHRPRSDTTPAPASTLRPRHTPPAHHTRRPLPRGCHSGRRSDGEPPSAPGCRARRPGRPAPVPRSCRRAALRRSAVPDHRRRAERGRERPLFPGSTGWLRSRRVAHNRSLTSVNSRVNCRKRHTRQPVPGRPSAPRPGCSSCAARRPPCASAPTWGRARGRRAQWQVALPHLRYRACNVPGRNSPMPASAASNALRCSIRPIESCCWGAYSYLADVSLPD